MERRLPGELETLLDECVAEMVPEGHGTLPVISDYVLVVALDDGASPDGGGLYMNAKANTPVYRTIGLLTEARRMVYTVPRTDD